MGEESVQVVVMFTYSKLDLKAHFSGWQIVHAGHKVESHHRKQVTDRMVPAKHPEMQDENDHHDGASAGCRTIGRCRAAWHLSKHRRVRSAIWKIERMKA